MRISVHFPTCTYLTGEIILNIVDRNIEFSNIVCFFVNAGVFTGLWGDWVPVAPGLTTVWQCSAN